jgi:hypothetical protein
MKRTFPLRLAAIFLIVAISAASVNECQGQTQDGNSVLLQELIFEGLPYTKSELRDRAKEWIGKTFRNGESVITSDTEGSLVGNYTIATAGTVGNTVIWRHRFVIDFKDKRARVKVWVEETVGKDSYPAANYWYGKAKPTKLHKAWLDQLVKDSENLLLNLKVFLGKKETSTDDW